MFADSDKTKPASLPEDLVFDDDMRKDGMNKMWAKVKDIRIDIPNDMLVKMCVSRALERDVACNAREQTPKGYHNQLRTVIKELDAFSGRLSDRDAAAFKKMVKKFTAKAEEVAKSYEVVPEASAAGQNATKTAVPATSTPTAVAPSASASIPSDSTASSLMLSDLTEYLAGLTVSGAVASDATAPTPTTSTPTTPSPTTSSSTASSSTASSSTASPSTASSPTESTPMVPSPTVTDSDAMVTQPTTTIEEKVHHSTPSYQQVVGQSDNDIHSNQDNDVLKPLKLPSPSLNSIPDTTRRQAVAFMFDQFKQLNRQAANKLTDRLTEKELPEMVLIMECEILKRLHHNIHEAQISPDLQQIEDDYVKQINDHMGYHNSLKKFVSLVKDFHRSIKNMLRRVGRKAMAPFKSFDGIKQMMKNLDTSQQIPLPQFNFAPRVPPPSVDDVRQKLFSDFAYAIFNSNLQVANLNGGHKILHANQIHNVARDVEALMFGELENKYRDTNISLEESVFVYQEMGNEYLKHIRTYDGFVSMAGTWLGG
jgi:hypothetical protein